MRITISNTLLYVCVEDVSDKSVKIAAEELQCKAMAENAQRDLDEAMPALNEAMKVNLFPVMFPNPSSPSVAIYCTVGGNIFHICVWLNYFLDI